MERRRPGPALLLALLGTTLLGAPSVVVTSLGGGRALAVPPS